MNNPAPERPNEANLVIRCQLGDQDAWRELVQRWNPRLIGFLGRMSDDSHKTDDLLQSTWLRLVRTITRLEQPDRFAPWAYRIARNTLNDQLRQRYRSPSLEPNSIATEPSASDETLDRWIESDEIMIAMRSLDRHDRLVINLHYFEHLTVAEVADVCQTPVGTIKSRLQRARRQLRQYLENETHQ
ncbi:RNA polymerase sigma factor [Rhodopirellula sp. JC639]|uniref:RNA polymerase sigma factor n=1 Tax=Stieleria mannarensis TaxID=2755585 RepID=UPI001602A8F4|nr:sigma-70 family RNA polymerase sigma factor [Rhodopirellula sp. JC639]